MTDKKKIGAAGEALAAEILKSRGYNIITVNFSCPMGEIDIVASKGKLIAFVEVKTRTSDEFGSPAEAIDNRKKRHIRNSAIYFLEHRQQNYDSIDFQVMEIRAEHITKVDL